MFINRYDDSSITILEGLDAVRKRPGMYIGSTDERGLHHLVFEILDNSIDEVLAGYGSYIEIRLEKDNIISILDEGRGVPCGMHTSGKNTLEVIYTTLHAGGKFGGSGYKTSGGLHGVGASVVNALSSFMEVTSYRDNKSHTITFKNGGKDISKIKIEDTNHKTGTLTRFKPDNKIFSTVNFDYEIIKERAKQNAYLNKNLKIKIIDEKTKKQDTFCFKDGISEYVLELDQNMEALHHVFYFTDESEKISLELAMQFVDVFNEKLISFVNNVRTKDGGTHEIGFKTGLTRVFNDFSRKFNLLKDKDPNLEGPLLRLGLTAVISVKVHESILEFEGQTKDKLGTLLAKNVIDQLTYQHVYSFLSNNNDVAKKVVDKALIEYLAREEARKRRNEVRLQKTNKQELNISSKLAAAQSKDKEINELFIVEGDSAGGSAKKGRDRRFQAILPLRGKILNTEKTNIEQILKNQEIATMIHAIGADFGNKFDLKKCNYKKIIIMTDADDDGAHIQVLLLTFFFRFMRPLFEDGRIFVAMPPLFKITKRGKKEETFYAYSNEEKEEILKFSDSNVIVQRYKGLGEMNADQLWDTTMNPKTRCLIQVNIDDLEEVEKEIDILMGDDPKRRRYWLESNVSFTLEDEDLTYGS